MTTNQIGVLEENIRGQLPALSCRFCGRALSHTFADLGTTPLCESYVRPEDQYCKEPVYPLHAFVCSECFLVQVPEVVPADEIFSEYAYFSSYSESWLEHARRYTERMIERFGLTAEHNIVEIASNDGYLLQYFLARGLNTLGIEPAANVAEAARKKGVPTLVSFFGERTAAGLAASGKRADLLIGNNVLAHVPNLNDFVRGLAILLNEGGVLTMEFPHLMKLVEERQFDTIYHEHFSYLSYVTAERILAAHGLTIFDVEELPTHGGSLRIYARRSGEDSHAVTSRVGMLRAREIAAGLERLDYYLSFAPVVKETKWLLLECLIGLKRRGKRIVAYGAPGKGNTLLNYCGIRGDFIDYAVDRSAYKQGKFTPGSRLRILPVETVAQTKPDYLLVLPWNLQTEITEQMSYIREWGGQFIIPIPVARVC